jgi:alpha-tubulin suppressor-like RCC1 family protein/uncharacterized membrane protein YgcG
MRIKRRPWTHLAGLAAVAAVMLSQPGIAVSRPLDPRDRVVASSTGSSLRINVAGLPKPQRASIVLSGHGIRRLILSWPVRLSHLSAGQYTLTVRPVRISTPIGAIRRGAVAYPVRKHARVLIDVGKRGSVTVQYGGIVNPGVRPAPEVIGAVGDPRAPSGLVVPVGVRPPAIGTILTTGPGPHLPLGLVARVSGVSRDGSRTVVAVAPVAVTDAVPGLSFTGTLNLNPIPGAATTARADAHGASGCSAPKLANIGAHLDSLELREAFIGLWPPQAKLTLAVRTTERLGVALAAVGINCDWDGHELGPYSAGVPVGPIVVPVYATLPFKAGIHVNGALQAGTLNVASTTVAHAAAGGDENAASLNEQGSNVWLSGALSLSGSAKLSASIGVQAGIGIAKAGNLHVEAGFGPEFDWASGHDCELYVNLGSLSAGVSVLGRSLNTPRFTPFRPRLWSGCHGNGGGSGGGGAGGGGGSGGGSGGGNPPITIGAPGRPTIAVGQFHTCAIADTDHVYCWGDDNTGQLGDGAIGGHSTMPIAVQGISDATSVAVGNELTTNDAYEAGNACALLTTGHVKCWGYMRNGLGDGHTTTAAGPIEVSGVSNAVAIALSDGRDGGENTSYDDHACAVLSTGSVECWGANSYGQLGNGTTAPSSTPVPAIGVTEAVGVAVGQRFTCVLLAAGTVSCWGNYESRGANNPDIDSLTAQPKGTFGDTSPAVGLSAGGASLCALHSDGSAACGGGWEYVVPCGGEAEWQSICGLGSGGVFTETPTAVQVSAGTEHLCAVIQARDVFCTGIDTHGQIGNGTATGQGNGEYQTATLPSTAGALEVAAGSSVSCARFAGDLLRCWGANQFGQLGDGTTTDRHEPTPVIDFP